MMDSLTHFIAVYSFSIFFFFVFFFQAEDGIRDWSVTGVQTCALPIWTAVGQFLLRQGPNTFLRVEFWTVGRKVFDVEAWVSRAEFLDRLPLMGGGVIQKHDEGTAELP